MLLPIFIIQALLFQLAVSQHANFDDLDPNDEMSEDEFESFFNKDKPEDPEEYEKRKQALKDHEKEIHEVNEKFQNGESSWFDKVNEFSDLPDEEFAKDHTGAKFETNIVAGRGLIPPSAEDLVDPASEAYFARIRMERATAPASYSSVDQGLVSPVKNQGNCGSCVAFSQGAVTETCFKKATGGSFADVSEQHFLDCGYKKYGANGCNGAALAAYSRYWAEKKLGIAHENQYGYKMRANNYQCPADLAGFKFGAKITEAYYTHRGSEDLLKELVYKHGAVITAVQAEGPFQSYSGGVFAGCGSNPQKDHAVVVVGYGTENGIDYWLVKNSWGTRWGDNGYIKVKRGVEMCGIGQDISATICAATGGPTEKPATTKKPCLDQNSRCPDLAKTSCYDTNVKSMCQKSCGLCEGMTPVESNTCYDKYTNCGDYKSYCSWCGKVQNACKKTCGGCGTAPVINNCNDDFDTCANYKKWCSYEQVYSVCKKTCNKCKTCNDDYETCPDYKDYCSYEQVYSICKKTCNKC